MSHPAQLVIPESELASESDDTYSRALATLYGVHAYHTKVPAEAIAQHVLRHTRTGDTVLDPFCGSGMTGIATMMTARRALLSDLSPAAVHIASNYTTACNMQGFDRAVDRVLENVGDRIRQTYETEHEGRSATVEYVVWSDVRACPRCAVEFALWDVREPGLRAVTCPNCGVHDRKIRFDLVGERPVWTNLSIIGERRRIKREFREGDLREDAVPRTLPWYPTHSFGPERPMWRRGHEDLGIKTVADFYSNRNLAALALLWDAVSAEVDERVRSALRFSLTAIANRASRRYQWNAKRPTNVLGSTLYISSLRYEWNVLSLWQRKVNAVRRLLAAGLCGEVDVAQASATDLPWGTASADYCFTDPPFGSNIVYSDSSFLWEAWLDNLTDPSREAIVVANGAHAKTIEKYGDLMTQALREVNRVLKTDAPATVVFQATDVRVWEALEGAATDAGFAVTDATVLAKGQPSFKQIKGHREGERVAAADVVLSLAKRARRRRRTKQTNLLRVLEAAVKREEGRSATTGHLFGIVTASRIRVGEAPLTYDEVVDLLHTNFEYDSGVWRVGSHASVAA